MECSFRVVEAQPKDVLGMFGNVPQTRESLHHGIDFIVHPWRRNPLFLVLVEGVESLGSFSDEKCHFHLIERQEKYKPPLPPTRTHTLSHLEGQ